MTLLLRQVIAGAFATIFKTFVVAPSERIPREEEQLLLPDDDSQDDPELLRWIEDWIDSDDDTTDESLETTTTTCERKAVETEHERIPVVSLVKAKAIPKPMGNPNDIPKAFDRRISSVTSHHSLGQPSQIYHHCLRTRGIGSVQGKA